jgi:iron complex transport system substrate-binding protein
MPGGKSYVAQFLKDAKGTYPWSSDKTTGSLPLSIEVVANKMLDADIWIDSQSFSLVNLKQKDVRYAEFKPYKEGNVYEHDARINKEGGNDFWESGALRVDLLLKDYIKILHPKILADHRLTFFRKLE